MKRSLEEELWNATRRTGDGTDCTFPRDWIRSALREGKIESAKQAHRTLEKWVARGWYEYGVSLDLGWRTRDLLPGREAPI